MVNIGVIFSTISVTVARRVSFYACYLRALDVNGLKRPKSRSLRLQSQPIYASTLTEVTRDEANP